MSHEKIKEFLKETIKEENYCSIIFWINVSAGISFEINKKSINANVILEKANIGIIKKLKVYF